MPTDAVDRPQRSLAPLIVVTVAATVFALLLILVREWAPLESVDHGAAARINGLVAGRATLLAVVKAITWLGSGGVLWTLIGAAAIVLAIRRRWRLAIYLLVAGAGALVLDPVLKSLVGRSSGGGASGRLRHREQLPQRAFPRLDRLLRGLAPDFPARDARPVAPRLHRRHRRAVVLIGISRILLGVHYISDVLGGWALGITWLGLTAFAFELTRRAAGQPVTDPVTEGLEPEARADLTPTRQESAMVKERDRHYGRIAAGVLVAWVLILGAITGIGKLIMITKNGNGNLLGDHTIPHWFAAHRTPSLNHWSQIFSTLGATQAILIVGVVTCVAFLAITRHWRPAVFVATVMFGELGAFLAAAAVVKRPRPDVSHLDSRLPTSAFPSGHEAATACLYIAIAILVIGHARGWWRYLFLIPAIVMPVMVALSRMYRGEHHPTDILASLLFAGLWLTATTLLIKPNDAVADDRKRGTLADRRREVVHGRRHDRVLTTAKAGRAAAKNSR